MIAVAIGPVVIVAVAIGMVHGLPVVLGIRVVAFAPTTRMIAITLLGSGPAVIAIAPIVRLVAAAVVVVDGLPVVTAIASFVLVISVAVRHYRGALTVVGKGVARRG